MINFSFPIEEIANFMAYISWLKNDTINKCENLHLYEETKTKVTSIKNSLCTQTLRWCLCEKLAQVISFIVMKLKGVKKIIQKHE
jgi:hypothetical protein